MVRRHLSPRHGTTVVAVLAALTLAGCSASSDAGSADDAASPSSGSTPTSSEAQTETETAEATPIDGIWSTPMLTPIAFRKALTEQRLGEHADAFVAELGSSVELTLEIDSGYWTLYSGIDEQPRIVTDRGTFELYGKRVAVRPNSGGENIFRWKVAGDELALTLVSTTEPPYEGVPAEVFQSGFYATSAFTREES